MYHRFLVERVRRKPNVSDIPLGLDDLRYRDILSMMRRRHLTVEVRSSMLLTFRSIWKIFATGVVERGAISPVRRLGCQSLASLPEPLRFRSRRAAKLRWWGVEDSLLRSDGASLRRPCFISMRRRHLTVEGVLSRGRPPLRG